MWEGEEQNKGQTTKDLKTLSWLYHLDLWFQLTPSLVVWPLKKSLPTHFDLRNPM